MLFSHGGGFSIGLYGMGSKIAAMDAIQACISALGKVQKDHRDILIRVRGYDETFPMIRTMSNKLAESKRSKSVISRARNQNDILQIVQDMVKSSSSSSSSALNIRIVLLIDSIDAAPMRNYQKFFSQLAQLPNVCLCASVDHPTIGLLWNPVQLRAFNWYWVEASTYAPYKKETANILGIWENLIEGRFESGSKSVSVVLNSLTGNHQDIVRLLATMQLEQSKEIGGPNGVRQSELLDKSTKRMIATNLSKLKSLLQELIDHKVVIEEKQKETGNDVYWIPLDKQSLENIAKGGGSSSGAATFA